MSMILIWRNRKHLSQCFIRARSGICMAFASYQITRQMFDIINAWPQYIMASEAILFEMREADDMTAIDWY